MKKILYPFKGSFPITQNFGVKINYTRLGIHLGVDWAMPKGTPLFAPIPGTVRVVNHIGGYGKHIYIDGYDGKHTILLAHCSQILVKNGSRTSRGDVVALSGNTGLWFGRNGYHLHFGLEYEKKWIDPLPHMYSEDQFSIEDKQEEKQEEKAIIPEQKTHTVKKGETLWSISVKYYGLGTEYGKIYEANKEFLSNPNILPVGVNLIIPQ